MFEIEKDTEQGGIRITVISDTHNKHDQLELKGGEILIHCGDFTDKGTSEEVKAFTEWILNTPYQHKIVIAGNHELTFDTERYLKEKGETSTVKDDFLKAIENTDVHYLENSSVTLYDINFYGSPHQIEYCHWAFSKTEDEIYECWEQIPGETDVLITHGPPKGILDDDKGCDDLRFELERVIPELHVFGHIHHMYGNQETDRTLYVNAANCDENLDVVNPPVNITLS